MTEKKTDYNGWTNYETWVVNLWLSNDQIADTDTRTLAGQCWQESATATRYDWQSREQWAVFEMAERLKDEHENASQDMLDNAKQSASVWADLLSAALSEVNWREIAEHYIDDVDKTETAESESL